MTNVRSLIIIWVITAAISIWFIRFGLSDWLSFPRSVPDFADHNTLRPIFRVIFGTIMAMFTIGTALVLTFRRR